MIRGLKCQVMRKISSFNAWTVTRQLVRRPLHFLITPGSCLSNNKIFQMNNLNLIYKEI